MPKLSMSVPHTLPREEVERRLKGLLDKIKERHGDKFSNFKEEWGASSGTFSFTTYGFNVKATATAEENQVKLDAELPFAAMMFKGKIEQEVRETLTRVLGSESRPE
jgi:hypothetical protein